MRIQVISLSVLLLACSSNGNYENNSAHEQGEAIECFRSQVDKNFARRTSFEALKLRQRGVFSLDLTIRSLYLVLCDLPETMLNKIAGVPVEELYPLLPPDTEAAFVGCGYFELPNHKIIRGTYSLSAHPLTP